MEDVGGIEKKNPKEDIHLQTKCKTISNIKQLMQNRQNILTTAEFKNKTTQIAFDEGKKGPIHLAKLVKLSNKINQTIDVENRTKNLIL